jgi:hypothetical protein
MKIINLQLFRTKKNIEALEQKMGELALSSSARELKRTFKQWLKATGNIK